MSVEMIKQSAQPTLYIRTRVPMEKLTEAFDTSFARIISYLSELGLQPSSAPYAAYHNDDMADLDVEMGFPVPGPVQGKGEIQAGEILAAEKAVSIMHKGSYATLDKSYEQIYRYIAENQLEISGPHYDFYISNPEQTPEDELLTNTVILVR